MPLGWFEKKEVPPTSEVKGDKGDTTKVVSPPAPTPAPPGKAPKGKSKTPISQLLSEDVILVAKAGQDKHCLLEGLVGALCAKNGFSNRSALLSKVVEREKSVSTTLDTGLSLPHARLDSISQIVAAMALVPQGIPDPQKNSADMIIRVMFLFFSPDKSEFIQPHLKMLREVSFFFQPELIEQLAQAPTPAAALELIRNKEA